MRRKNIKRGNRPLGKVSSGGGGYGGTGGHPYGDGAVMCVNVFKTSPFGERPNPVGGGMHMHWGTDLAGVPAGSNPPIYTMWEGTVTMAGDGGSWGNTVMIRSENVEDRSSTIHPMIYHLYAHLNSITVSVGDNLTQGDQIGTEGTTGNSTGDHLHLEIAISDSFFNGNNGAVIGRDIFDPETFYNFDC